MRTKILQAIFNGKNFDFLKTFFRFVRLWKMFLAGVQKFSEIAKFFLRSLNYLITNFIIILWSVNRILVYTTSNRRNAMGVGLVFEADLYTTEHPSHWVLQSIALTLNAD